MRSFARSIVVYYITIERTQELLTQDLSLDLQYLHPSAMTQCSRNLQDYIRARLSVVIRRNYIKCIPQYKLPVRQSSVSPSIKQQPKNF